MVTGCDPLPSTLPGGEGEGDGPGGGKWYLSRIGHRVLGVDLTDDDCYEAMREIPGYLDISLEDFREVYRLALAHAAGRLTGGLTAGDLMEPVTLTLTPDQPLDQAVRSLAGMGLKGAPVVDGSGRPVGMLSETDVLRSPWGGDLAWPPGAAPRRGSGSGSVLPWDPGGGSR